MRGVSIKRRDSDTNETPGPTAPFGTRGDPGDASSDTGTKTRLSVDTNGTTNGNEGDTIRVSVSHSGRDCRSRRVRRRGCASVDDSQPAGARQPTDGPPPARVQLCSGPGRVQLEFNSDSIPVQFQFDSSSIPVQLALKPSGSAVTASRPGVRDGSRRTPPAATPPAARRRGRHRGSRPSRPPSRSGTVTRPFSVRSF